MRERSFYIYMDIPEEKMLKRIFNDEIHAYIFNNILERKFHIFIDC